MGFDAPGETDRRRSRIWALSQKLRARGYDPQIAETDTARTIGVRAGPVHHHPE